MAIRKVSFQDTVELTGNAPIDVKPEGGDPGHMWGI